MLVGVNWSVPQSLPVIQTLIQHKIADFCEILVDNVIHLSPELVLKELKNIPIAFHIMTSRFLERSDAELKEIAKHIRHWIDVVNPMYVSDHLVQFTQNNKRLPFLGELNYAR